MISPAKLLGAVFVSTGLLVAAVACGGGSGSPRSAPPRGSGSADPRAAFQQCLQQHGITLQPSGRPDGGTPSARPSLSDERREAFQACASALPNGQRFGGIDESTLKAFQNCMRDHGVKAADAARPSALRTEDPKVAEAFRTCRALLPQRPTPTPT